MTRAYGLQTDRPEHGRRTAWLALAALPFFALLGMGMATQKIAGDYGFQEALGDPLVVFGSMPI